jgi:putative two-component system response regulator
VGIIESAMHERHPQLFANRQDETRGECSIDEMQATLLALGQAVEQRDGHTGSHCKRLAYLGVAMGVCMELDRDHLVALYRGGYLHDIGKVGIPDSILLKPGKLTGEEWMIMRTHTTRGEEICRHVKSLHAVLPIIRHHHERWDGSGYPDGLSGTRIPLLARVLQVADIYDALTNPRAYREACSPAEAIGILREEDARGWRDPEAVRAFLALYHQALSRSGDLGAGGMRLSLNHLDRTLRDAFRPGDGSLLPVPLQ